ncbi:MAG TPA: hypothetical protein VKS21_07555 [Spirochaetota bacterium]|nr:hypothetical protein [Spirochaetota bacterium]
MKERRKQNKFTKNKTLVIEDNQLVADMYVQILDMHKIASDHVDNLKDAFKALDTNHYNLVILDGDFPEKAGSSAFSNYHRILQKCENKITVDYLRPVIALIAGTIGLSHCIDNLNQGLVDYFYPKPCRYFNNLLHIISENTRQGITRGRRCTDVINDRDLLVQENKAVYYINDNNFGTKKKGKEIYVTERYDTEISSKIFISYPVTRFMLRNNKSKLQLKKA